MVEIANFDRESVPIFWTTWKTSMKFSGKMWFMTILKVTIKQGLTLSSEDATLEKSTGVIKLTPGFSRVNNFNSYGNIKSHSHNF